MKSFQCLPPLCLTLLLCASAGAQTVYRCGSSYSQTPCQGATVVPAEDPRTEAQRAAAMQAASRDKELANAMEAARQKDEALMLEREKAAQTARLAETRKHEQHQAKAARSNKKAPARRKAQVPQPDVFNAIASTPAPKKKARAGSP